MQKSICLCLNTHSLVIRQKTTCFCIYNLPTQNNLVSITIQPNSKAFKDQHNIWIYNYKDQSQIAVKDSFRATSIQELATLSQHFVPMTEFQLVIQLGLPNLWSQIIHRHGEHVSFHRPKLRSNDTYTFISLMESPSVPTDRQSTWSPPVKTDLNILAKLEDLIHIEFNASNII